MEISVTIIAFVVLFLCVCSFAMGIGVAFFLMARDKSLIRLNDGQVIVEQMFLDQVMDAVKNKRRGSIYDQKIQPTDYGDD